jgi:hypothetical protein
MEGLITASSLTQGQLHQHQKGDIINVMEIAARRSILMQTTKPRAANILR